MGAASHLAMQWLMRAMFWSVQGHRQPLREDLEPCEIPSRDGSRLEGALLPARGQAQGVVVFCHPFLKYGLHYFTRNKLVDATSAIGLHSLLFNFKGFGASRIQGPSYFDDVIGAVAHARERFPGLPVHLIGCSFGGYHALHALARMDGQVERAWLDSVPVQAMNYYAQSSVRHAFRALSKSRWASLSGTEPILGSLAAIKRTRLLFVFGEADQYLPEEDRKALPAEDAQRRYCWFSGAKHMEPFKKDPDRYEQLLREHLGAHAA